MSNRRFSSLISKWFCGKGAVTETTTLVSYQDYQKQEKLQEKIIPETFQDIEKIKLEIKVDLCFVLDCTSSMGPHIASAKNCIQQVVDYMKLTSPNIKLWIGFVGYRDFCDGPDRLQIFDFTDSISDFKTYISDVQAIGGGDAPEDVLGGLNAAVNDMSWSNPVRVLLHIGDCPPHGRRFTRRGDDYPKGDPNGLTAEKVLRQIRSAGIHYYFGKITDKTNEMIRVFRRIIGNFLVFDLSTDGNNPEDLIAKVFESICSSITTTVTLNDEKDRHRRKLLEKDSREPEWTSLSIRSGEILYYRSLESLNNVKELGYFKGKSNLTFRKFSYKQAPKPFASGAERYAYFALDVTDDSVENIVIKERIEKANSLERCLETVEISTIARFLSKKFNSVASQVGFNKKVNFLKVKVLHYSTGFSNRYYTIEPKFRDEKFKRFNVNSGVIKEYHSILEAFAHFTYEYTGGYLVVYDLQGIELPDQFLLTDSAIHCTDRLRFGRTNLGTRGIVECFLANHKCDITCQKLGLSKISY